MRFILFISLFLSQAFAASKFVCKARYFQIDLTLDGYSSMIDMKNMFDHTNIAYGFVSELSSDQTHEHFSFKANQSGDIKVSFKPHDLASGDSIVIALIDVKLPFQVFMESMRCLRQL
jgi:hypothetical protein